MLVLQFIPEPDRAVHEMRRVTRPGGTVAAATWDTQELTLHRIFFETAGEFDARAREIRVASCARRMSRAEGLLSGWRSAGLEDVGLERLTVSMDFASFTDFWRQVEGRDGPYAQYFQTLDAQKQEKLRAMVEAVYRDGRPDGPRSYPAAAWAVRGTVP